MNETRVMPRLWEFLPLDHLINSQSAIITIPPECKPQCITIARITDYIESTIGKLYQKGQAQAAVDGLKWIDKTYTISQTENIIVVNPTEDTYIMLPDATKFTGRQIIIKNVSQSKRDVKGYAVIAFPMQGQTLNIAGYRCIPPRKTITLFSTGMNWEIEGE